MYIPSTSSSLDNTILGSLVDSNSYSALPSKQWSSTIGVVTAICGNILISFALNTQRYAHLKLSQDREDWNEKQRQERKRARQGHATYGTQQKDIAEERARKNLNSEPERYTLEEPENGAETDPLIPSVQSVGSREDTASSQGTANEDEEAPKEKSYLKSPIWWLGITMMTVGEAGNFLAYGFAPASIVSPLGVVALISNCLVAPLLLHERFRWRDGIGVIIAVAGCVTVVMSASDSNPKLDPDTIWHLITRWEFETYLGITVVLIIALMVASNRFGDRTILIDLGLMGLFGGYTALSTKGVASLLSNKIWRVITFPITYLLVAVLVFTAVMQIKYVNRALQRFNATMVIPTQFVLFTLSVIVGSAVLYRDFERTTGEDAAKFVGGCALTFLGVWFITSGRKDSESDEEMGEDEDAINLMDDEGVQPEIRERDDDRRQSLIAGSSKDRPQFGRYQSTASDPSAAATNAQVPILRLGGSPLIDERAHIMPANAAAIRDHDASPIPPDEDQQKSSDRPGPSPMHATTSAPIVPTTALRPHTPLKRGISEMPSPSPATPKTPQLQPNQHLDSNITPKLLSRHSVSLFPGPLTSPLSSSLSAIVADSLRRGVDQLPTGASLRRRSIRRSQSKRVPDAPPLKRHSIASGEMDFEDEATAALRRSAGSPPGRMRSLSATLSDIFGSSGAKRQRGESAPQQSQEGGQRGNVRES